MRAGEADGLAQSLQVESDRLTLLDQEYEAMFAGIESKLREAGLNSQIPKLTEFAAHYRKRIAALRNGVQEAASGRITEAKISQLRAMLSSPAAERRQPENSLHGIPAKRWSLAQPKAQTATSASLAADSDDLPTPADLAENSIIRFTPEIRAKAAELGNSPVLIYQYVQHNFEFDPYNLVLQGPDAVYWSGRGNETDLASFLIAVLRAAGTPARYVLAMVRIPYSRILPWFGVKSRGAADAMLSLFNSEFSSDADAATFLHYYVEAYTDTEGGKAWVRLDPSFKTRQFPQPGILIPRPAFDRMGYLTSANPQLGSEAYLDGFRVALAKTNPGASLSDAAYEGAIIPDVSDKLPASLPYEVTDTPQRFSDLTVRNIQHHITIVVTDPDNNNASLVKAEFNVADLLTHSLTIGFVTVQGSGSSQAVMDAFGGAANTPLFLLSSLTPEIRLDGKPVATGKQAASLDWLNVRVGYFFGKGTDDYLGAAHMIYPAQTMAVVFNGYQATDRYVGSRVDSLLNLPGLGSSDAQESLNNLLQLAGLRYFSRVMQERKRLATPLQLRYINYMADEAAVLSYANVTYLFDRPFLLTPERMVLDARAVNQWFYDLNSDDVSAPGLVGVRQAFGLTESSLEHELWEELLLIPSVSTTKLLQLAKANNASILTITSDNAAAQVSKLQAPDTVKTTIQTDVADGKTVVITDRPITLGKYQGLGWISEDPDGTGAYMLMSVNGGDSGNNPPVSHPPTSEPGSTGNPTATHGTACSDPVTVSNGNLFQTARDFLISSRGPAFVLNRTYNSLLSAGDGPFGFGWTHNYNLSLKDNQGSITLTNETGGTFAFSPPSVLQGNTYLSPVLPQFVMLRTTDGYTIRHKNGAERRFNKQGRLITIADRLNNTMQFVYDDSGRLTQVTDSLNRAVAFTYNTSGRITAVQDFAGRKTTYEYDVAGNLAAATDPVGNRTVYAYYTDSNFNHLLKSVTTPAGKTTTYEYYVNRKAARTVEPGGRTVRFLYLPLSSETVVIDGRGFATTYVYNALGNVTRMIKPDGNFADRVYTPAAQPAALADESGNTTRYEYDAVGNVTSITDPLGNKTLVTYEPKFSGVASIADPRGSLTKFEYDATGNLTRVAGPLGAETRFTYDNYGQVLTATNAEGNTISFSYDGAGNLTQVTDPLGNVTRIDYDPLRRPWQLTDPVGSRWSAAYDALDRMFRLTDPLGNAAVFAFTPDNLLAQFTDVAGRVTHYAYDGINNLNQVTDAQGNATSYDFNISDCGCSAAQNLVSYRGASGQTLAYAYNANDSLTQVRDALGGATNFMYDGRSNLIGKVDASGNTIAFEYDAAGRLVRKAFPDGTDVRLVYDAGGNLMSASNQNVTYTFTYDELNRLKSVNDSRFNKTLSYAYDRLGRRTLLTDPEGGVFSYSWDANNRLVSVKNPAGATAMFGYDALGRRTSLSYSNNTAANYQYDAVSRLTSLVHGSTGSTAPFATYAYIYDKIGNPRSVTDISGTHTYQYDELDRLVAAAHPSVPAESYRYDGAGNRLRSATDSGYAYDAAGRLISAEGFTYRYDSSGNLLQKSAASGVTTYAYDAENRLVSINFADGSTAAYKYDPFGRRIEKNVNGTVTAYLYDRSSVLLELDPTGSMQARYTHGPGVDEPLIMERGGRMYFYHLDGQGNVSHLTDASGTAACSYRYDSFGRTQACQNVVNPYTFVGREYDGESGLYYMRARYYDPVTGRFVSSDPLDLTGVLMTAQDERARLTLLPVSAAAPASGTGTDLLRVPQQLNPYSYALNNPVAFRDPSGLKCGGVHVTLGLYATDTEVKGNKLGEGNIHDLVGWLVKNEYLIEYTLQQYVNIVDSSHKVIGIVKLSDLPVGSEPLRSNTSPWR